MICNHCGLNRAPTTIGSATSHVCRACINKIHNPTPIEAEKKPRKPQKKRDGGSAAAKR